MGVASNYASQYKRRLLEDGVIGERGRGLVGFDIPAFREFLNEKVSWRAKIVRKDFNAWQSAILLVRAASISTNTDCHALFEPLGELASELSHLFQLGRGGHAVALGHAANGDNALGLPLAVRAG